MTASVQRPSGEKKILTALPKMVKAAQGDELKAAFQKHRDETEVQVERLVEVFGIIEGKPQGKTCPGINGILETALYTTDLECSTAFYQRLFGLQVMYVNERMSAFDVGPGQLLRRADPMLITGSYDIQYEDADCAQNASRDERQSQSPLAADPDRLHK